MALAKTYFDVGTYTGQGNYQRIGVPTKRNASTLQVSRSLRFRSANSAYLSRTPGSATNRTTWTWSGWIKIGNSTSTYRIFDSFLGGSEESCIVYNKSANEFRFEYYNGTSYTTQCVTSAAFKDPSVWYHLVLAVDTTQATSTNRILIYVNNLLQTLSTATYPSQNAQFAQNSTNAHYISRLAKSASNYFDGYLSEVIFVDGQALTPSSFGVYNSDNIWVPQTYSGTYGANGFYLPFSDNSALTTASNVGLGKDFSGNTNYWITNSISITSDTTYDSMIDTPTDAASATQPVSNYCVLDPFNTSPTKPTNGNLTVPSGSASNRNAFGDMVCPSGKWYWEITSQGSGLYNIAGLCTSGGDPMTAGTGTYYGYSENGNKYSNAGPVAYGNTWTTNDVIGVAFDVTNGKVYFSKNGTFQNTGDPVAGTNSAFSGITASLFPWVGMGNTSAGTFSINFGQRPFTYTPPTGFSALCTSNITAPADASKWFYGGSPDFVWIKDRTSAYNHSLNDSVRGWELTLKSSDQLAETSASDISDVNKFGMTLIGDTNYRVNKASDNYVYWAWKAGGAPVVNSNGTITSNVSVNATAGFSIVTWTGTGANATVGHGLGVAPSFYINMPRTGSTIYNKNGWHTSLTSNQYCFALNTTAAQFGPDATLWNSTSPTSSVFSVGTSTATNLSGGTYVTYCFAPIAGYSAFGSYTGNGSADGPFVYCGFRPRWIMAKRTDSTGNWYLFDTTRASSNEILVRLNPDISNAESTDANNMDALSNGFKLRNAGLDRNASGGTYIYAAFAENPFNVALAR